VTEGGKVDLSAPAPRTPDGKPDLTGVWRIQRTAQASRVNNVQAGPAGVDPGSLSANIFRDMKPEDIPEKPEGAKVRIDRTKDGKRLNPSVFCLPMGIPTNNFVVEVVKFVQAPKEIIVMSNGEKIPPADLEEAITRDRLFDQVMVYGEARPTLVALVVVNPEQWLAFAQKVGVRPDMPESLHDSRIEQQALDRIAELIKEFPGYAIVRRVLLMTEPWSIENGLLTPTLKLKRTQVMLRFAKDIEQLYEGH